MTQTAAGQADAVVAVAWPAATLPLDDPRHGQRRGYAAGCRCGACRQANSDRCWEYRLESGRQSYESSRMPSFGAIRRLRALSAVGHTQLVLAADTGISLHYLREFIRWRYERVGVGNWEKIAETYLWLADQRPTGRDATRIRRAAAKKGWATPEQWPGDTIDDPEAWPIELDVAAAAVR